MGYDTKYLGKLEVSPIYENYEDLNSWLPQRHFTIANIDNFNKYCQKTELIYHTVDDEELGEGCWNLLMLPEIEEKVRPGNDADISNIMELDKPIRLSDYLDVNYNVPPFECPSLWSDLIVKDGKSIVWNQSEKTYEFANWLKFLINNFLSKHDINGEYYWQGERTDDRGVINIKKWFDDEGNNLYEILDQRW